MEALTNLIVAKGLNWRAEQESTRVGVPITQSEWLEENISHADIQYAIAMSGLCLKKGKFLYVEFPHYSRIVPRADRKTAFDEMVWLCRLLKHRFVVNEIVAVRPPSDEGAVKYVDWTDEYEKSVKLTQFISTPEGPVYWMFGYPEILPAKPAKIPPSPSDDNWQMEIGKDVRKAREEVARDLYEIRQSAYGPDESLAREADLSKW